MRPYSFITWCFTVFIFTSLAQGQEIKSEFPETKKTTESNTESTEKIVVTASRTSENLSDIPLTVQVIDKEELRQFSALSKDLGFVLEKLVPGISANTNSLSNFSQNIRGRKALVLINGIPQYENRQISRQLSTISLNEIERVEIVSGASSIYGAGATGGLINVITKSQGESSLGGSTRIGLSASTNASASDSLTSELNQNLSGQMGSFGYGLKLGAQQRGLFYSGAGEQIAPEPAQVSRDDTKSFNGQIQISYDIDNSQNINLVHNQFYEEQETNFTNERGTSEAIPGLQLEDQALSQRRQSLIAYNNEDFFGQELNVQVFERYRKYRFFPFILEQPFFLINQSTSESQIFGSKVIGTSSLNDNLEISYGFDLEREQGRQQAVNYDPGSFVQSGGLQFSNPTEAFDYGPDVLTERSALFSQLRGTYGNFSFRAGARVEWVDQKIERFTPLLENVLAQNWGQILGMVQGMAAANQIPPHVLAMIPQSYAPSAIENQNVSFNETSYNLGALYKINKHHQIFTNYSEGYELADTSRLLRDFIGSNSQITRLGAFLPLNTDPKTLNDFQIGAIKVRNTEVGYRNSFRNLSSQLVTYFNTSDKLYQFNDDFTVSLLDQDQRNYGFEASLQYLFPSQLALGSSYSKTWGEFKDQGDWRRLTSVETNPEKWTAFVGKGFGNFYSRLQYVRIFDYDSTGTGSGQTAIEGYETTDLSLSYISSVGLFSLGVTNLFNEDYKTVFHQWAESVYGPSSGISANGRRYSFVYEFRY